MIMDMDGNKRRKRFCSTLILKSYHHLPLVLCTIIILALPFNNHYSTINAEPFGSRTSVGGGTFPKSFQDLDAIEEHDLLQAIRVPFDDPRTQYFEGGLDGFPAYGLREGADVKSHYRLFLPDRLYRDFALLATVKLDRLDTSYLFSVVNPLDTLVQFGIKISPSLTSSQQLVSLLYTDVHSHLVTQTLTSFEVPLMTRKWNRFALKVVGDNITLYFNCREHSSKLAMRNPKELTFDSASILYIGQAGPILKGNFQNFSSGESSGDFDLNLNDYSYPENEGGDYDDDLGEIELGSGPLPPPIPGPPPIDFNPLRNLMKGDKGQKGERGPQGTEVRGPPGPPGERGPPGKGAAERVLPDSGSGSGDEFIPFDTGGGYGTCKCNYTEFLLNLPQTFRGLPGPQGEFGPPGPEGKQGPVGEKGDRGDIGGPGPEGLMGPKGEPGRDGEIGPAGPPGPPGSSAMPNFVGYDPDWRPRNLLKDQMGGGALTNRVGMPGPKGEIGEAGPRGERGERGYPGEKGERGHGTKGDKGFKGDIGPKGTSGSDGLPGLKGEPGVSSPINYMAGNNLDTVVPLKGEPGPIGPPGERGPPGLPGSFNLEAIQDLLKDLKGEKGDPGIEGRRGRRGKPGPPGISEIGAPGWPSTSKPSGRPGAPGLSVVGPKGEKGEPAVLPDNFFNYEVVTRGPVYVAGPPGLPGPAGAKGDKGDPGISVQAPTVGEAPRPNPAVPPPDPAGSYGKTSGETISKIVPGAVVFLTREAMLKMSELSPVGTISFVKDEESLFARVSEGWKPLLMGDLIRAPILMGHPEQHTTELPRVIRPLFEASSLTNRIEGPSLRLAALNDPWSGDMHGVRGADYSCYRQARNANLIGTFRAFLASYVQNLDSIVKYTDRNLPVLNTKGELLFNSWSDIFQNGGHFLTKPPPLYSFNGRNVLQDFHWPQKMIWHGSDNAGIRATSAYCEAWHSDSISNVGLASDLLRGQILGQENVGCNNKLVVLCIEIASQQHYRRRRRSVSATDDLLSASSASSILKSPSDSDASHTQEENPNNFLVTDDSHLFKNLTFEEYTQLVNDYDESFSSSSINNAKDINNNTVDSTSSTGKGDEVKSQEESPPLVPIFEEEFH